MRKPYTKPPLSCVDQVKQLKLRGLVVADEPGAVAVLQRVSYYRLSGYTLPFKQLPTRTFANGTTFDDVMGLYEFDRRLRVRTLDGLERVEVLVRTSVIETIGHAYGAFGHLDRMNFVPTFNHLNWLDGVRKEVSRSKEVFIDHFKTTYAGFPDVPIWMAAEVVSLGTLSHLFGGMTTADRTAMSAGFGVTHQVLANWLHTLTYVRNLCAHHGRLWNRKLAIRPMLPRNSSQWTGFTNDRVFAVLSMIRYLTRPDPSGRDWALQVKSLLTEVDGDLRMKSAMGIPPNWISHPIWT